MKPTATIAQPFDQAGGVMATGYLQKDLIERVADNRRRIVESFNLAASGSPDGGRKTTVLPDGDAVKVFPVHRQMRQVVFLEGHVKYPREYEYRPDMRVTDLIFRADNLLTSVYAQKASLPRVAVGKSHTDRMNIDFSPAKAMAGDASEDIELRPSDNIYIREIPLFSKALERKIALEDKFKFPGEYTFAEGERLSSIIARTGGMTEAAYPFGAVFMRGDIKDVRQPDSVNVLGEVYNPRALKDTPGCGWSRALRRSLSRLR